MLTFRRGVEAVLRIIEIVWVVCGLSLFFAQWAGLGGPIIRQATFVALLGGVVLILALDGLSASTLALSWILTTTRHRRYRALAVVGSVVALWSYMYFVLVPRFLPHGAQFVILFLTLLALAIPYRRYKERHGESWNAFQRRG